VWPARSRRNQSRPSPIVVKRTPGSEEMMMLAQIGSRVQTTVTQSGIGIGSAVAIVLSWHRNKSILLAILHGVLSWLYVIYFALTRRANER
jgi:hypothetical protein